MLFGPLLGQQPLATRVDGNTLVVETRTSLNMLSLTLEQVLSKRHKLIKDMAASMVLEVRMATAGSGLKVKHEEKLHRDLAAHALRWRCGQPPAGRRAGQAWH